MVFEKNVNAVQLEKFEMKVVENISSLPSFVSLIEKINKNKWNARIQIQRENGSLCKYSSFFYFEILNERNEYIIDPDEHTCILMLIEPICFVRRGRIIGVDLSIDEDFLEEITDIIKKIDIINEI